MTIQPTDQEATADRWHRRYSTLTDEVAPPVAAAVLVHNTHLLPALGTALDLACGLGGNALLLAGLGFDTLALDRSAVAIDRLRRLAAERGLGLRAEVRDVVAEPPAVGAFDVIVVSRFLDRTLAPALMAALRPGGLLYYQTYTREKAVPGGPDNPAYLLDINELLTLFRDLRLVVYREEGRLGDSARGLRNEAQFVGQKHP